jgi:hypothetical protein
MGTDAQLHAMGQISLVYNEIEDWFSFLFEQLFPTEPDFAARLFHRSNNKDRVDVLKAIVSKSEPDHDIRDRALWALECFDICTTNRNVLAHARSEYEHRSSTMRLVKKSRADHNRTNYYPLKLKQLRDIADEMGAVLDFMVHLHEHIHDLRPPPNAILGPMPEPLPDKPPKPRRLDPIPWDENTTI